MNNDELTIREARKDKRFKKMIKLLYSILLSGAAAMVLILYEGWFSFSIYFVYLISGLFLGMSIVLFMHLIKE